MTHEDVRARLSALIDGALAPREAAEVEAHLHTCPSCREALAQLRATVTMLGEVEPVQAPEGFADAVRGRLERLARSAPVQRWDRLRERLPRVRWSWRVAAAAAAVAVIGIFAVNLLSEMTPTFRLERAAVGGREGAAKPGTLGVADRAQEAPPAADTLRSAQPVGPPVDPIPLRRVIRTGHLTVEVEVFDDASRRLVTIAEGAGGFIADSSYSEGGGTPRGTFVLRVPAAQFADVLRQMENLGTVQRRQISGQDVTEEYIDLEARVRNLERQEARLLSFIERATKIADLLAIENELGRVRGQIERLTGRLRFLANRVDLATIQAELLQKPKPAPGGFWNFDRTLARISAAFLATVRQLLGAVEGLAAFVAALVPIALLAGAGWLVVRRSMRRPGSTT